MKKSLLTTLVVCTLTFILAGCGAKETSSAVPTNPAIETVDTTPAKKLSEITIVYTNDVHSFIDNATTDDQGNITGNGLRFSKIAAMVADMKADNKNVLLVDAGDQLQGNIYGAIDQGESIIKLLNATGYDLATPGNHDFDYGVSSFLKLKEEANYPYITCNFESLNPNEDAFKDYKIFDFDGTKVAFVGITTPETITSSTPVYFQNENGAFIYTIDGMINSQDLYASVQDAVDAVKPQADYVIALGHVGAGLDAKKAGIASTDIIANTTGIDAFIDGHSHTLMECSKQKNKEGKDVILTQTGSYLASVGVMTIDTNGNISTKLVSNYDKEDESVAAIEQEVIQKVSDMMGERIGTFDTKLYVNNPKNSSQRIVRAMETNAGDFVADSIYWYFNEYFGQNCDIVLQNAGGIRAEVKSGMATYSAIKTVEPFGNMVCLISATGQQILDAIEMGVSSIGAWDNEWNIPAEYGGFMQVAGLKYTVDASVESSVKLDENGMFEAITGDYRVKDVQVYNKKSKAYEPLDVNKKYAVGGINYVLRNGGNGLSMFFDDNLIIDYVGQDYVILADYVKNFADNGHVNTTNSPISSYEGYLINYENPYGAGRITIDNVEYPDEALMNRE